MEVSRQFRTGLGSRGPYKGHVEYTSRKARKFIGLKPLVNRVVKDAAYYRKKILDNVIVDEETGCWNWTRSKNNLGYGFTSYNCKGSQLVHRVVYMVFIGPIPAPCVNHACDNPGCCNPDHLWSGTQRENMRDMVAKCRHGSMS